MYLIIYRQGHKHKNQNQGHELIMIVNKDIKVRIVINKRNLLLIIQAQ